MLRGTAVTVRIVLMMCHPLPSTVQKTCCTFSSTCVVVQTFTYVMSCAVTVGHHCPHHTKVFLWRSRKISLRWTEENDTGASWPESPKHASVATSPIE